MNTVSKAQAACLFFFCLLVALTPCARADTEDDSDPALESIAQQLRKNPYNMEAHRDAARLLLEYGEFKQAAAHYELAVRADPASISLKRELASVYLLLDRSADAVTQLIAASIIAPQEIDLLAALGDALVRNSNFNNAQDVYEYALLLAPDSPTLHSKRAFCFGKQQDFVKALHELEEVVRLSPKDASAYNNLGVVHEEMGDYDAALAAYQRAHELSQTNSAVSRNLLRIAQGREEFEKILAAKGLHP